MDLVHVAYVDAEFAHVKLDWVTVDNDQFAVVKFFGEFRYSLSEKELWGFDDFVILSCLKLLIHPTDHKGSW